MIGHDSECDKAYWRMRTGSAWQRMTEYEKWQAAFRAGARYDQVTTGRLAPALSSFMQYVSWLQLLDEQEADAEV